MASIFENLGDFQITRLRAQNTAYLSGAVASIEPLPAPVALARGPDDILGPKTAVTVGATWAVGVTMPAVPEVIWVLIRVGFTVKKVAGINPHVEGYVFVFGDVTDIDNFHGPVLGHGQQISTTAPAAAGTFTSIDVADPAPGTQVWVPLDPADTSAGWTVVIAMEQGAVTPPGIDDLRIDASEILLLGYPTNAWNTGALWAQTAYRGS